ncbi:hypothetical protein FRC08_002070 [Ceratobasidium sp. 394]|nr:hypothetical protein FRC08_002070 [Ceratobasidium sp. 394]
MILDHGPTPRKKPYICLQKISLELTISRAIHELARGINALDVYDILETSPPLPLQMCLDDLIGQLFCHLTESFPALFGAHSTPLQKNAQFLSSSLDSMLRIMNASADGKRKAKADQAYKRLVDNARSRSGIPSGEAYLRALDESRGDSGSTIKNATAAVGCDRDDLARSLTRRMYCVRMKLLPRAKRQGTPVALPDAEEIAETYDSAPETTAEEHAFIESTEFCDSLDADNRSREDDTEIASSPLRISSPAESILEMDSPPTSPLSSPFNTQEPMDTELLTGSACSCLDRVEQGQAQDEILEFSDDDL